MFRVPLTFVASFSTLLPVVATESAPAIVQEGEGQSPTPKNDSRSVFPGLLLMATGSVVSRIVLPRYEEGRISSLIKIATLTVETESLVRIKDMTAALYDKEGNMTKIISPQGYIDFTMDRVCSEGKITMEDPRFQVCGQQLYFDTYRKCGVVRGPVRTVIPATQNYTQR